VYGCAFSSCPGFRHALSKNAGRTSGAYIQPFAAKNKKFMEDLVQILISGLQKPVLFLTALNFSPNCPHSTAKIALLKIKFLQFRLRIKI
jgi:hypothetical protein